MSTNNTRSSDGAAKSMRSTSTTLPRFPGTVGTGSNGPNASNRRQLKCVASFDQFGHFRGRRTPFAKRLTFLHVFDDPETGRALICTAAEDLTVCVWDADNLFQDLNVDTVVDVVPEHPVAAASETAAADATSPATPRPQLGALIATLRGHSSNVTTVVSIGQPWNTESSSSVASAASSSPPPFVALLATCCGDGTTRLWSRSGESLAVFPNSGGHFRSMLASTRSLRTGERLLVMPYRRMKCRVKSIDVVERDQSRKGSRGNLFTLSCSNPDLPVMRVVAFENQGVAHVAIAFGRMDHDAHIEVFELEASGCRMARFKDLFAVTGLTTFCDPDCGGQHLVVCGMPNTLGRSVFDPSPRGSLMIAIPLPGPPSGLSSCIADDNDEEPEEEQPCVELDQGWEVRIPPSQGSPELIPFFAQPVMNDNGDIEIFVRAGSYLRSIPLDTSAELRTLSSRDDDSIVLGPEPGSHLYELGPDFGFRFETNGAASSVVVNGQVVFLIATGTRLSIFV